MELTYEELTEILISSGGTYEIREEHDDGRTSVYRGSAANLSAFFSRVDQRRHEHRVYDSSGQLLYHRDVNGRLYVANPGQWERFRQRKKVSRDLIARSGVLRGAVRRGVRWGTGR